MGEKNRRFENALISLRTQIADSFAPGESLPSFRTLGAMHGVGTDMIRRAIKVLSDEKLVKVVPRIGAFRSEQANSAAKSPVDSTENRALRVALLTKRNIVELPKYSIYKALQDEALRRQLELILLTSPHYSRPKPSRQLIELQRVPWNTFDIGLLVEAEQTIPLFPKFLKRHNVLSVDQDATQYGINSVCFADYNAGAMAAKYLMSLGHKRFAILDECNAPGFACDPAWTARNSGFENTIREFGGVILPEWRIRIDRIGTILYRRERHFKKTVAGWAATPPAQRPTALFAMTLLYFRDILIELAQHGLQVPRHMSVIVPSIDGQIFENEGRSYTSMDFGLAALARRTFDFAYELWNTRKRENTKAEPKAYRAPAILIPRESTTPPVD